MEFRPVLPDPIDGHVMRKWAAGPYNLAVNAYAFGQHRIQVWYKEPQYCYPDVLWTQY